VRLAPIKSRVPLGSSIRVTIYVGDPLEGTLVDIDDECLIISDVCGNEIILEATAISMVVRISSDAGGGADAGRGGEEPRAPAPAPAQTVESVGAPVVRQTPLPAESQVALAKLTQQVRAISLDVPVVEWDVYDGDLGAEFRRRLRRDLVAERNRYEYAVKMKLADRILHCVSGLRRIADEYQAPDALQIAGRILWRLGRREEARDLFADAADALDDSLSCFDLAMAQRQTGEQEQAPATLRRCIGADSPPLALALTALSAMVLTENAGRAEFAALIRDAAGWPAGATRLSVLHCGLICVPPAELTGFPGDQWDSADASPEAFLALAEALHSGPLPEPVAEPALRPRAEPAVATIEAAVATAEPVATVASDAASPVESLALTVHSCLNRKDLSAAELALAQLRKLAPEDSLTWNAERAVSNARTSPAVPIPGPPKAPARKRAVKTAGNVARDSSPLALAEDAFRRNDLEVAETLFRQAIVKGDQPTRAVRRLVNMLYTRLKNREEALSVLDENRHLFRTAAEVWTWSQARSTVLEHAGRWPEAIEQLRPMISSAPTRDDRSRVVRRITAALLKSTRHEEAKELLEEELRRHPWQRSLETLLEQLNTAMETNIWSVVEMTLQLQVETTTELSPLLAFHLDRCEYWGVPAESRARGQFTEEDIERVDRLVSGRTRNRLLGKDLPRERAEANLSAARIMQDLGITDDGFRKRLRFFAAAMGDACALEARVTADVIRGYYTEAVSVKSDWDDVVDVKLRQLVMSFTLQNVQLLEDGKLPSLEKALALVMRQRHLAPKVLGALLALPTQGEVPARLIRRIWADRLTRELFQQAVAAHLGLSRPPNDQQAFTKAWTQAAELDRNRRRVYRQINGLTEVGPALVALDRHGSELNRIYEEMRDLASTTDLSRVMSCQQIVSSLRQYSAQGKFVERERLFGTVRTDIRRLVTEFETAPTVLSVESLHPYLFALDRELEEDFQRYSAKAAPENLMVEVVLDRYLPGAGEVTVQLQVSNGFDAMPVSNVELEVVHSQEYTASKNTVPVAESIGAGESRTCQLSLTATPGAIEQELITLHSRIGFTLRSGERVTAHVEPKSIRLHPDDGWAEIPNPFSAGLPVHDPSMFKGRDELIAGLIETVGESRGSVIVYGQKRAGKSSVLYHLREKLPPPYLPVSFSIGDLAGTDTLADLLYAIGMELHQVLSERVEDERLNVDAPPGPDVEQIRLAPQPKFIEYMRRVQRWLKDVPGLADSTLVLLIDEFTVIHTKIRTGGLPNDFMKGWKAMLERGFFRCVLVGNDLMPRFILEYPNEFQVALEKRVSYLDDVYARQLIEDPIRLPDRQSRYRGNAVDLILSLTGRSPYYIQLLCHALVQYMNQPDVRAAVIGPADVDTVAKKLIAELDRNQFDNLLTPGDSEVTDISADLVIDVLRATHRDPGRYMSHEMNRSAHPDAERVIQDLERREVVKRISGDRVRIQVGLFSEWLQHRWV
jgi:tetratricopeptide (TPR) repeat protein